MIYLIKLGCCSSDMSTAILMTLVALARSDEIKNEWICEESDLKGNCSSSPKFKYFMKEIIDNIDNYEYSDHYYCPSVYY